MNLHYITLQPSFVAVIIAVVSFFLTSWFIYTYVLLILINQCSLNVVFSIMKELNGQSSSKQNLHSPHLSMLFGKACLLYEDSPDSTLDIISWLVRLSNIIDSKLSRNKSDELLI